MSDIPSSCMLLTPVAELLALRWLIFLPTASPCSTAESTLESGADVSAIVLWFGDQEIGLMDDIAQG